MGLLLSVTACSTTHQQTKGTIEPSAFLGDYSQMQTGLKDRTNLYYMRPGVNWAKAADRSADFSKKIREGLPGIGP